METKKMVVLTPAQNGKTTPKQETAVIKLPVVTGSPEVKEPTTEELKQVIEALNKRLSTIPQDLDKRIEYFNLKKELIRKLSKLDGDKESLTIHLDRISELAAANEFDNEEYYLNIEGGSNGYNKKAIYTLKNPLIIGELIAFIIGKVDRKREVLKREIEA